jgi:hypothetical protein
MARARSVAHRAVMADADVLRAARRVPVEPSRIGCSAHLWRDSLAPAMDTALRLAELLGTVSPASDLGVSTRGAAVLYALQRGI